MTTIDTALGAMRDLIKTFTTTELTDPPDDRVWIHPGQSASIKLDNNLPAVIISKMNDEPGEWASSSYGVGMHKWQMLIAVYLAEGPVVVTNSDDATVTALANANEWYEEMADLLFANMTLGGVVDILGDDEGTLYQYITDNIIWDGKQYYGHLFLVPVRQEVVQGVSA